MNWTDSHAHATDPAFSDDREEILVRSREAGVTRVVSVGCESSQFPEVRALVETTPGVIGVLGFHPSLAGKVSPEDLEDLPGWLDHPGIRALGECGLDYHWEPEKASAQKELFEAQIAIANKIGKPIVIHEREAWDDAFDILKASVHVPVLLHCFSHTVHEARLALDLGWHLALGGPVTFASAESLRDVARFVPLDRLLLETDCPYLSPHPFRGKRNEPARTAVTGLRVATVREMSPDELSEITTENGQTFFGTWEPLQA